LSIALEPAGPDCERKAYQGSPAVIGVQDLGTTGGDEGRDRRIEWVPPRVAAANTRSQVNIAIRRIR
jgi:hypothetical protein